VQKTKVLAGRAMAKNTALFIMLLQRGNADKNYDIEMQKMNYY
jgi:hypothetical protein